MNRDEAIQTIQAFAKSLEVETKGLNKSNLGGLQVGEAEVWFEYVEAEGALHCSALIFQFDQEENPAIVEACRNEAKAGANTGGGAIEYQPENKGIYLTRVYAKTVPPENFEKDMTRLLEASQEWSEDVFPKAAMTALGLK